MFCKNHCKLLKSTKIELDNQIIFEKFLSKLISFCEHKLFSAHLVAFSMPSPRFEQQIKQTYNRAFKFSFP